MHCLKMTFFCIDSNIIPKKINNNSIVSSDIRLILNPPIVPIYFFYIFLYVCFESVKVFLFQAI